MMTIKREMVLMYLRVHSTFLKRINFLIVLLEQRLKILITRCGTERLLIFYGLITNGICPLVDVMFITVLRVIIYRLLWILLYKKEDRLSRKGHCIINTMALNYLVI